MAYVEVRSGGKLVGRFEKRTGRWGALRDGVFLAEGQRYIEPREPTSQELAVQGASSLPVVTAAAGAASVGQGLKILGKEIAEEAGDYLADKLGIPLLGPTSLLKPRRTLGAADDAGNAARKRLKQGDDAAENAAKTAKRGDDAAASRAADDVAPSEFKLGKHGDFASPRPTETQSHHGAMSAWMKEHFPGYDPEMAPAILMPTPNHQKTFGVYNTWRAEMRQRMGGAFDWGKVSEADMRALSEKMFDAAEVPTQIRTHYWIWFERMKGALPR